MFQKHSHISLPLALFLKDAVDQLTGLSRSQKRLIVGGLDAVLCVLAVWVAYYLRLGEWRFITEDVAKLTAGSFAFWLAAALLTGVYREVLRFTGGGSLFIIAQTVVLMLVPMMVVFLVMVVPGVPRTLSVLQPIVYFLMLCFSRLLLRFLIFDFASSRRFEGERRRILIYGAGTAGLRLASAMRDEPGFKLEGYVDDDPAKAGGRLDRMAIHRAIDLPRVIREKQISDIYLAIPSLSRSARRRIIEGLDAHPVQVMAVPNIRDIIEGSVSVSEFREIDITDLLGRSPIDADPELMAHTITGKTVVVTGAGGSIGSELCTQIARLSPARLVMVELSEFALYSIDRALARQVQEGGFEIVPELCNVADRASITRIIRRHAPDTIFHAAAYKHVPLVEANVLGGARNNIIGTLNTVLAAIDSGTSNFILISTDKAVRPTNIMGATKRVCEQILQAQAQRGAERGAGRNGSFPIFTMVRFGNVLGSSGSVVPLFKQQIRDGGPLTVTDRRINRYFMTIPEAAELVIQAGAMAKGGEVYVLDMGEPVKIIDLARTMIRLSGLKESVPGSGKGDIEIVEVGLRPGEKLYEELLIGDNPAPTSHPRIMQARENHMPYDKLNDTLSHLLEALDAGRPAEVRELIAMMVPEYAPATVLSSPS